MRESGRIERELDTVPPNIGEEHQHPSPTSSPPTPPSPLPVSVGPGYQRYFFPSSPPSSPPFSPSSSPPKEPQVYETIPPPSQSMQTKPAKPASSSYTEYSPLLPHFPASTEDVEESFPSSRRRPTSWFRQCLERICCCCELPDCCPPLFTDD